MIASVMAGVFAYYATWYGMCRAARRHAVRSFTIPGLITPEDILEIVRRKEEHVRWHERAIPSLFVGMHVTVFTMWTLFRFGVGV